MLLALSMGLVLWVRLLPLSLPVTDDWAERLVRQEIRDSLALETREDVSRLPGREQIERRLTLWVDRNREQVERWQSIDRAAISAPNRLNRSGSSSLFPR